jgi:uncharacterized SAM-binding protein YcdF (DUF218 family)
LLGCLVFIWAAGFAWFITIVPSKRSSNLLQTDAIVVLTGGSARLGSGLALLVNGYSKEMFISGVGKGVSVENLFELEHFSPEKVMLLKQRVFLGYGAEDTYENGLEVASWVVARGHKTIRLVTSNYHMPRSLKELSSQLPDTKIITYPVFPETVKTEEWWSYPGTRQLLLSEYMKYIAVILRNLI